MSGLNIQRLRDIFDDVYDSLTGTLKTGGAQTIVLGIFRATGAGTGYSIDDIIVLRQTPPDAAEYFNVTTGAVIATPDPADLGSVSSASNVAVTSSALPTGASTSALQSAVQADAGSDASKAIAVQGVTGGKVIPVSLGAALPAGSNTIGSIANTAFGINGTLPAFAATPTVNIGSTQRTPSLTSVTSSGTIALGARSVAIANIGAAAGTVLGTSVGTGVTVNFTAQSPDTLAAIAYDATGTTFLLAEVR